MIDILIPTYFRAGKLDQVVRNIQETTTVEHRIVFIREIEDGPTDGAIHAMPSSWATQIINKRTANYPGAMNTAVEWSDADYWFFGSDDLRFEHGWDQALELMDDQTMVVGTNDLHNPFVLDGIHATHYLVDRRYVEKWGGTLTEGPGVAFFEGYTHQYTDTEFIGVAKARCRFKPCLTSIVEHMHYTFGRSQHDATYTRAYEHLEEDRLLYLERKKQWSNLVV